MFTLKEGKLVANVQGFSSDEAFMSVNRIHMFDRINKIIEFEVCIWKSEACFISGNCAMFPPVFIKIPNAIIGTTVEDFNTYFAESVLDDAGKWVFERIKVFLNTKKPTIVNVVWDDWTPTLSSS